MSHRDRHRMHGFTLLELSVVLAIIAVILGTGLTTLTAALQASQYNVTVARMDTIEKALLNYAITNYRIPCPADLTLTTASANYGVEAGAGGGSTIATATGACTGVGMLPQANFTSTYGTAEGSVPTRALQLSDDYMYDGWGRKIRYAVNTVYTKTASLPASMSACPPAAITVNDATGTARTTNGIYALISHGTNGHGAYTSNGTVINSGTSSADKLTNCHCSGTTGATNTASGVQTTSPGTYVQKAPAYDSGQSGNASYFFDDIVAYKEPWQTQALNFPISPLSGNVQYLAVTYGTSPYLTVYCLNNGNLSALSNSTTPPSNTSSGFPVDFSADNSVLAWGGVPSSGTIPGYLYSMSAAGVMNPISFGNADLEHEDNKFSHSSAYLAVARANSSEGGWGYFKVYTGSGLSYSTTGITISPIVSGNIAVALAWQPDDSYVYVAEAAQYLDIYARSGGTFTRSARLDLVASYGVGGTNGSSLNALSVHSSGKYIAIAARGVTGTNLVPTILQSPTSSPVLMNTSTSGLASNTWIPKGVAWSPDGTMLAVGFYSQGVGVYSFNQANADAGTPPYFSAATISGTNCPSVVPMVAWSADSNYLAAASTSSPYLCLFSRSGTTFTRMTLSASLQPPSATAGVAWSH